MAKPTEPKNAPIELAPRYWTTPEWLELSHEERMNFTNAAAIRHATGKWPVYAQTDRRADHEAAYKALLNVVKPVAIHREDEE